LQGVQSQLPLKFEHVFVPASSPATPAISLQKVMAPNKMRMLTVNETRFDVLVTSALLPSVAQNGAVM